MSGNWEKAFSRGSGGGRREKEAPVVVRGVEGSFHVKLREYTTIGIGGAADRMAFPRSPAQVREVVLAEGAAGREVRVLGAGSNLLVADGGVSATVLCTRKHLSKVVFLSDETVVVEAGPLRRQPFHRRGTPPWRDASWCTARWPTPRRPRRGGCSPPRGPGPPDPRRLPPGRPPGPARGTAGTPSGRRRPRSRSSCTPAISRGTSPRRPARPLAPLSLSSSRRYRGSRPSPSFQTSPAPIVRKISPGRRKARTASPASEDLPTYRASRCPCSRTARHNASPVAPSIGSSPAEYTSNTSRTSASWNAERNSRNRARVRVYRCG